MHSLMKKITLCMASLLVGLVLLEMGLRVLYPTPFGFVKEGVVADDMLCYRLPINFSAVVKTFNPPYKSVFTTTKFGSRTAGRYQEGLPAVLMLGDSFTLGIQVQDDETFAARVAQTFSAEGKNVNVLNFGTLGYNPFQYLLLLNRTIAQFSVRSVVVNLYVSNDVVLPQDNQERDCVITVVDGYLVSADWKNKSLFFKLRTLFHRNTQVYNFVSNQLVRSEWVRKVLFLIGFAVNNPENPEALLFQNTSKSEEYYTTTFSVIDALDELTKRYNASLVLMLIPSKYHVDKELWKVFWQKHGGNTPVPDSSIPFERIKAYAQGKNMTVVDLYEIFMKDAVPARFFGVRDDHYNQEGHERHAEEVVKVINA